MDQGYTWLHRAATDPIGLTWELVCGSALGSSCDLRRTRKASPRRWQYLVLRYDVCLLTERTENSTEKRRNPVMCSIYAGVSCSTFASSRASPHQKEHKNTPPLAVRTRARCARPPLPPTEGWRCDHSCRSSFRCLSTCTLAAPFRAACPAWTR